MSGEQSAASTTPSVALGKTASSRQARRDSVSSMETDDYVCIAPSTPLLKAIEAMKQDEGGCAIVATRQTDAKTARDARRRVPDDELGVHPPRRTWIPRSTRRTELYQPPAGT